jgi:menaquinone-9 beta-reductase
MVGYSDLFGILRLVVFGVFNKFEMNYSHSFNVIIIGAGPSGCGAGMFLAKHKIPHLILDKSVFPRDKICGDALSSRTLFVLKKIDPDICTKFNNRPDWFQPFYNVLATAPNLTQASIPIAPNPQTPAGYIVRRLDFDLYLTEKLDKQFSSLLQGANVTQIIRKENGFEINYSIDNQPFTAFSRCIIAADGDRSIVKKTFAPSKLNPKHYAGALRAYYKGIEGFSKHNEIEVYFPKSISPGYLWVFPLPDGRANVGIGMLSSIISKKKINLKTALNESIENDPTLKARFKNATLEGKIMGWGLPLGSKIGTISGDGFLLTGDAGGLIDPLSGEGIGTGLYSGMLAADAVAKAIEKQDFTANFFDFHYTKRVKRTLGIDFKVTYLLQIFFTFPRLLNFGIGKMSKNKTLLTLIAEIADTTSVKKQFINPVFYWRILKALFKN